MAGGGEDRGDERDSGPGTAGALELPGVMHRGADQPAAPAQALAATQMQPRFQGAGQPLIPGDDEAKPPGPAEPRDRPGQSGAVRVGIMPEQHAAQPARQLPYNWQGVRRAAFIRKKPERHCPGLAALYPAAPGD